MIYRAQIKKVKKGKFANILSLLVGNNYAQTEVEHVENYGFQSVPPDETETFILSNGGAKTGIAIGSQDVTYKVNLEQGEAAVYTKFGQKIVLKKNGDIEVLSPKTIHFKSDSMSFKANKSIAFDSSSCSIKTSQFQINSDRFAISGGNGEVFSQLMSMFDIISKSITSTAIGLQPLMPAKESLPIFIHGIRSMLK